MAMQEHELLAPDATSTSRKGLKGHVKSAYMSTKKFFKGHGNKKYQSKEHGDPMIVEVRLGQPKPSLQNPDKGHDASHIDPQTCRFAFSFQTRHLYHTSVQLLLSNPAWSMTFLGSNIKQKVQRTSSATNAVTLEFSMLSHTKKQVNSSVMVTVLHRLCCYLLSDLYFACNSHM